MNFTGSLIRPTFSFAFGALVMVWGLSLWTADEPGGPSAAPGKTAGIESRQDLKVHRAALRQLGKKLAVPEDRAARPQRLASNP